jgi:hypothetical protein
LPQFLACEQHAALLLTVADAQHVPCAQICLALQQVSYWLFLPQ